MKAVIVAGAFTFSGCGVVPSVNILGSFFPAWLISIVIGVVLTVLTRQAFLMTKIAPYRRAGEGGRASQDAAGLLATSRPAIGGCR
jgi:hypothetical protein